MPDSALLASCNNWVTTMVLVASWNKRSNRLLRPRTKRSAAMGVESRPRPSTNRATRNGGRPVGTRRACALGRALQHYSALLSAEKNFRCGLMDKLSAA